MADVRASPAQEPARRRGRRQAGEDTRADILAAARHEFAARGYEATTLRGIARAAGVDARLVHHYFDGKDEIFAATMEIPAPQELVARIVAGGADGLGERLLRIFFSVWDTPQGRERVVALISSVLTSETGARMIREFLTWEVFGRIVATIGGDDPGTRAALAASQIAGLMMVRYVVRLEPLASADPEDLIPLLGPTLQRYLVGDLG